jgi:hypothetical protein
MNILIKNVVYSRFLQNKLAKDTFPASITLTSASNCKRMHLLHKNSPNKIYTTQFVSKNYLQFPVANSHIILFAIAISASLQ